MSAWRASDLAGEGRTPRVETVVNITVNLSVSVDMGWGVMLWTAYKKKTGFWAVVPFVCPAPVAIVAAETALRQPEKSTGRENAGK